MSAKHKASINGGKCSVLHPFSHFRIRRPKNVNFHLVNSRKWEWRLRGGLNMSKKRRSCGIPHSSRQCHLLVRLNYMGGTTMTRIPSHAHSRSLCSHRRKVVVVRPCCCHVHRVGADRDVPTSQSFRLLLFILVNPLLEVFLSSWPWILRLARALAWICVGVELRWGRCWSWVKVWYLLMGLCFICR